MTEQSTPTAFSVSRREPEAADAGISLRPGLAIGRYQLVDVLARGSFGTVWSAREVAKNTNVAIKFLHPFLCESSEAIARLRREADAIATINHPNVVKVVEFNRLDDGRPYIVMELLEGTNLYARVRTDGFLSPNEALELLDGVCAALTATHGLGIIHRDIKASNVFVVDEDGTERTVLLDYGLAKILESDGPQLTKSRATLGTPSAMSPEQIRGEPVTARSDVYALGALAYHLLTGEPAFFCCSRPTILYMHLHSQRPRPSRRVDVSPAFDAIIAKAMARKPEKRYSSAMAFLAEFASAVRSESSELVVSETMSSLPQMSARMLGVYVNVNAKAELLADPSDELLDDLEAIAEIAEPILGAARFEVSARRGNSVLFVKVVNDEKERAERRKVLRLLSVIRAAIESRPNRVDGVSIRIAVDVLPGGVDHDSAASALLAVATRVSAAGSGRGTYGTERFFDGLGLALEEASLNHDFYQVANNSEF